MLTPIILAVVASFSIAAMAKWLLRRKKLKDTVGKIPGPAGHPVFGILSKMLEPPERIWCNLREYAAKYYPIYVYWRISTPVVNLLSPEDIEIVLSSTKHTSKSFIYKLFRPWLGTGILTSEGTKWRQRRKILTPSFHFNILQQFLPIFIEDSNLLVQELEPECDQAHTDVEPFVTRFTLRSICETAMGVRLDVASKTAREYVEAVDRMGELLIYRITRPWLYLDPIFRLSPTYRVQKRLLKILHGFGDSVIKKRKAEFTEIYRKKPLAFLDLLLAAQKGSFGTHIDDQGIREEVDSFMFGGHDTTAITITFSLLMLACHPGIQEKVVDEIRDVLEDQDRPPTYQDLQNLHYMERVIKEVLRLYPSAPFISRIAGDDIETSTGYKIPAGTSLFIHIYDLHRNPRLYPDSEKFDPDRFLSENSKGRHPYAFLPFSAGPRNCMGQKYAMVEVKTVLVAVLRKFVLKPVDSPSDVTMIQHLVLKPKSGVRVKFERREN